MEISTALICDFAQVREGLLIVASGGVTRMYRDEFPAPMNVMLALVISLDQIEMQSPHELRVAIISNDGAEIASIVGGFQLANPLLEVGEQGNAPVVLDLRQVGVTAHGAYDVKIYLDSQHQQTLTFYVVPLPPGTTVAPPPSGPPSL